mmetsp:Transcript_29881/g.36634  ORF Transcript_29881/g.36634 Transcript_29881/m.36634 type:complete len:231 (-) Transcript_29881:342-1034(-)
MQTPPWAAASLRPRGVRRRGPSRHRGPLVDPAQRKCLEAPLPPIGDPELRAHDPRLEPTVHCDLVVMVWNHRLPPVDFSLPLLPAAPRQLPSSEGRAPLAERSSGHSKFDEPLQDPTLDNAPATFAPHGSRLPWHRLQAQTPPRSRPPAGRRCARICAASARPRAGAPAANTRLRPARVPGEVLGPSSGSVAIAAPLVPELLASWPLPVLLSPLPHAARPLSVRWAGSPP